MAPPLIQDQLEPLLLAVLGNMATRAVLRTLPGVLQAAGTLDLVEVRELMTQLDASHRLYSTAVRALNLEALRQVVTGGKPVSGRVEAIEVRTDMDVLTVQRTAQRLARGFFSVTDGVRLATAASELARNIRMYAKRGTLTLRLEEEPGHYRFEIHAVDAGPGIPNLPEIVAGQYTSKTGLGRGIIGTKALVDEMELDSAPGQGTRIRCVKRARRT
jgi:serine/threonine-protein kinase RsbT